MGVITQRQKKTQKFIVILMQDINAQYEFMQHHFYRSLRAIVLRYNLHNLSFSLSIRM